jgi:hypothetical protein
VEGDEGKHQALQILDQVMENSKSFRVFTVLHVVDCSNFGTVKKDVGISENHLKLLLSHTVGWRPFLVVFLKNIAFLHDAFQLFQHREVYGHFLADHDVVFVVRIVRIAKAAVAAEFKLHELMPKLSFVASVVPKVKLFVVPGGHGWKAEKERWESSSPP